MSCSCLPACSHSLNLISEPDHSPESVLTAVSTMHCIFELSQDVSKRTFFFMCAESMFCFSVRVLMGTRWLCSPGRCGSCCSRCSLLPSPPFGCPFLVAFPCLSSPFLALDGTQDLVSPEAEAPTLSHTHLSLGTLGCPCSPAPHWVV